MDSADCDEHLKRGLGGRTTSSGTEPSTTTAESLDDAVRRLVVERSHDLVTLCDLNGAIVYASPSWARLGWKPSGLAGVRSEEHTSELQSRSDLVCRLLLEKKKK